MNQIAYLDPATLAMKQTTSWHSHRLECETTMVRWGHFGTPLLLFPTAGGDAEEVERFFLIKTIEPMIHDGRVKVYSVDSIAGRTWLTNEDVGRCVWIQKQYDEYLINEVVPAIRKDCHSPDIEVLVAGASIGALNSLVSICRHPEVFSGAICMSGTYDIDKWLKGHWYEDFHHYAPLHFVPLMSDEKKLTQLRKRMIVIPTGEGKNEDVDESWKVAHALGEKSIPNRVDLWGKEWDHDWVTWRKMLPQYVEEMLYRERDQKASPADVGDSA